MIASILCYVLPSVELLGHTTQPTQSLNPNPDPLSFSTGKSVNVPADGFIGPKRLETNLKRLGTDWKRRERGQPQTINDKL